MDELVSKNGPVSCQFCIERELRSAAGVVPFTMGAVGMVWEHRRSACRMDRRPCEKHHM